MFRRTITDNYTIDVEAVFDAFLDVIRLGRSEP